jgi:GMP synthase (glutamine-hydrolysing)
MSSRRSIESAPKFLIVQTGSTLPELRARRGDFPHWFQRGIGLPRARFSVVRADAGQPLPATTAHAGVIVTGSPAMVSERLDWSERTADWLRQAVQARVPLLGVCYGHQLLAHALGGSVDYHPIGREVGTVGIECLPAAVDDVLLGAAPARFLAHASHRQSVLALPAGAVALARSAHDPHHAVRYAPNAWGLQFHPEFSVEVMRGYLRHGAAGALTDCRASCCDRRVGVPAPHARHLLRRFRDFALLSRGEPLSCRRDGSLPADRRA